MRSDLEQDNSSSSDTASDKEGKRENLLGGCEEDQTF